MRPRSPSRRRLLESLLALPAGLALPALQAAALRHLHALGKTVMLSCLPRLVGAILLWVLALPASAIDWQAPLTVASGGGARGPWRQNDSRYD